MKKLFIVTLFVGLIILPTGCNKEIGIDNYKFDKAIISFNGVVKEYEIQGWRDYSDGDQIQITTKEGEVMLVHSSNIILTKTK